MFGFAGLTPMELLIILVLGVLLFGKKLPDVGRSLGTAIVEFKRGLKPGRDPPQKPDDPDKEPPESASARVPRPTNPPTDSASVAKTRPPPEPA